MEQLIGIVIPMFSFAIAKILYMIDPGQLQSADKSALFCNAHGGVQLNMHVSYFAWQVELQRIARVMQGYRASQQLQLEREYTVE
jgi:hypothetical protein